MRVALLTSIVAPYRAPVFRALAATPGWRLRVFVNAETEFDRSWRVDCHGLDVERIPGLALARGHRTLHLPSPPALLRALARFSPDVVLSGELGARSGLAALYCGLARVPWAAWCETTRLRVAEGGALRRALGPLLLGRARAVAVPGREAARVMRGWRVPAGRMVCAPNAHDHDTLMRSLDGGSAARAGLRRQLGARECVALVPGRLHAIKGVLALLAAWERVPAPRRERWSLVFVGEGPLADEVARTAARLAPGEILHAPAVQPEEMAAFYAAADLCVFPSLGDVWGIAVSEAMACGLPVVCSSRAGCAPDLVRPGVNGWLADAGDPRRFAAALNEALASERLGELGGRARKMAERFHPEATAEGLRRAVRLALAD